MIVILNILNLIYPCHDLLNRYLIHHGSIYLFKCFKSNVFCHAKLNTLSISRIDICVFESFKFHIWFCHDLLIDYLMNHEWIWLWLNALNSIHSCHDLLNMLWIDMYAWMVQSYINAMVCYMVGCDHGLGALYISFGL